MWIVFEDKPDTVTAKFYEKAFEGTEVKVGFSGGGSNIFNYVQRYCGSDGVIAYHDTVPDNPDTAKSYKVQRKLLRDKSNVLLVPIVCSEFILLQCAGYPLTLDNIVTNTDYEDGVKSAEQYCKYFIGTKVPICKATGKYAPNVEGIEKYYKVDCLCDDSHDECISDSVESKSMRAVRCLPVIPAIEKLRPFGSRDVRDVINSLLQLHNSLVSIVASKNGWGESLVNKATISLK